MKEVLVGKTSSRLWLLMAAVLSVLLIACINLANAQLARLVTRDREAAVRSALGASASRILQSALAEVLLLSVTGGILGIALALVAVRTLASYTQLAIPRTQTISVNFTVLALSILLTVGATFICGVLPALRLLRIKPQQALQGTKGSAGSRRSALLRRWLVGAQVFACTALLLLAGLFAKSLVHLSTFDKGFSTDHVLAADVFLQGNSFKEDKVRAAFDDGVLEKLRALPGVQSVSLVSSMILEGERWIDGVDVPSMLRPKPQAWPTIAGSAPATSAPSANASSKAVPSTTAIATPPMPSSPKPPPKPSGPIATPSVVSSSFTTSPSPSSVSPPTRTATHSAPHPSTWSTSLQQQATLRDILPGPHHQDPHSLTEEIRNAIWSYNPNVTIARIHTLDSQISDSLAPEHLQTVIFAAFGAAALLLALLGIYGTLSYSVSARTQEVGIRMALGATRQSIYKLMLGTVVLPVGLGLTLGCLASLSIGRSLASLLYGTKPTDLSVIVPVVCIFAIAAVAATFVPCRRAANVEPMEALRTE